MDSGLSDLLSSKIFLIRSFVELHLICNLPFALSLKLEHWTIPYRSSSETDLLKSDRNLMFTNYNLVPRIDHKI